MIMPDTPAGSMPARRPDITLFDFESGTFDGWSTSGGDAFGPRPVSPAVEMWPQLAPHQRTAVFSGWEGCFLVHNNIWLSEKHSWRRPYPTSAGRRVSPDFIVERRYLQFRFAGILNPGVRIELWVEGSPVRVMYGHNHFDLTCRTWNVTEFSGRPARIELVCEARERERILFRADAFRLTDEPGEPDALLKPTFAGDTRVIRPGEFRQIFDSSGAGGGAFSGAQLVRTSSGWHVFAVEQKNPGTVLWGWHTHQNDTLFHASSPALDGPWSPLRPVLKCEPSAGEKWLHAPAVCWHEGRFIMLMSVAGEHVPDAAENDRWRGVRVQLFTSVDGARWVRETGSGFREPSAVDGLALLRRADQWVCFYASIRTEDRTSKHPMESLVYRTSADLRTWSEPQVAMPAITGKNGISNGQNYFFWREGYWYLVSHRASPHWERTRFVFSSVWRSRALFKWDLSRDYLGMLNVWGSPNVVSENGRDWRIMHWHVYSRGAWLAPLTWHEGPAAWPEAGLPPLKFET